MIETVIATILQIVTSPWFQSLLPLVIGWILPQPKIIAKIWKAIMGVRNQVDEITQLIDTIDAVLKANGLVPADSPKPDANSIKAMLNGNISITDIIIEQEKNKLKKK